MSAPQWNFLLSGIRLSGIRLSGIRRWIIGTRTQFVSESGNVESALTLIPLMLLFLSVTQLCISVYSRTTESQVTQGTVAYTALGSSQLSYGLGSSNWSSTPIALPLPGGGSILVGEREIHNPAITPLLPGGDSFLSTGIAVQE